MTHNKEPERIIKEHRKWTRWLETRQLRKLGNLVLTNRRIIFLHMIQSSPEVKENIKKLADTPIENVLNYAYNLNSSNFQIPLSDIESAGIGIASWYPSILVCLKITFRAGRQRARYSAAFQFIRPIKQTILKPQIAVDIGWIKAINQAKRDAETKK